MFTYALARRLDGSGVTATVLHPGVVRSAFGAEDPARWHRLFLPLVRPFMKTPARGAETSVYLASASKSKAYPVGTSPTAGPGSPARTRTTLGRRSVCGR